MWRVWIICPTLNTNETDPIKIFNKIACNDFVRIHGPEHHFLDGACLLTAVYNVGGEIDINKGLKYLAEQSVKMPGAMCGNWGVCGAVTSIGAALSFIDGTGPLSKSDWGKHMQFTSSALAELSSTGGPRCCKRDVFFALGSAIEYINKNHGVGNEKNVIKCAFSYRNEQCLKDRYPFYIGLE